MQDQTDQALGDVQGQLSQSEMELNKAFDRNRNMEQQQVQLNNQVKELKQEINTLRASMAQLDQGKDQLLVRIEMDYFFFFQVRLITFPKTLKINCKSLYRYFNFIFDINIDTNLLSLINFSDDSG